MQSQKYEVEIGGKTLTAEFTNLADQTNGSVLLRYGSTVVLATVVMGKKPKEGQSFLPLTVDYEEKFYAAGAILGSRFIRREGKPSDEAILSGRIVDRTIRPLFPQHLRHDVQVVITVLAAGEDDPDILAVNATSIALNTSNIPWNGPIGAVRVGKMKNQKETLINPSYEIRNNPEYEIDIVACGKSGMINMIEVGAMEQPEEVLVSGLEKALEEIKKLEEFQKKIADERGVKKIEIETPMFSEDAKNSFKENIEPKIEGAIFSGPGKKNIEALEEEWMELVKEKFSEEDLHTAREHYEEAVNDLLHRKAITEDRRADGRALHEIRPLFASAGGISPVLHGSGIFFRGGTHVISFLTLGGPQDSQIIDSIEERGVKKRFMHHYNFPPFSSGETGRMGGLNRRMVGHGALAEKAIAPVIPPLSKFPYTIRLVSECVASNGSTSMASVCAATLALMDGGVPILRPVAGIALGLMSEGSTYKILTDIQGPEDHHGDMDFKVAGTDQGITAVQLDVKVTGVPLKVLAEALERGKEARLHIIKTITTTIAEPRADISPSAPKVVSIKIEKNQIGLVIGSGGKTINDIRERTNAEIEIEDDGTVFITGKNGAADAAKKIIEEMTREYSVGEHFEGEVVRIADFGAFVSIGYNAEGLVHISEIAPFRIERVANVLSVGEKIPVVIKGIDERERISLSIKDADSSFAEKKGIKPPPQKPNGILQ